MTQRAAFFFFSLLVFFVFKIGLFDAPAEHQQVVVALHPLCQLSAGQSGGENGEKMTEHQSVQLGSPATQK